MVKPGPLSSINSQLSTTLILLAALSLLLVTGCSRKGNVERHLQNANQYFAASKYDKAEVEYINVLRVQPTNFTALHNLGTIYLEQELGAKAVFCFRQALMVNTNDVDTRLKWGLLLRAGRRVDEARFHAEFVLSRQPTNDEAIVLLASTVSTNVADIQQRLESLRPIAGNRSGFHRALARIFLASQKIAEAEAAFKQALALDPKSAAAQQDYGNFLLFYRDNPQQAEPYLKAACDLSPPRSIRRLQYANFKQRSGDVETAKKVLTEITDKAPDYLPAWNRLADITFDEKKYDDCQSMLQRVLIRDPNDYEALTLSGRLKLVKGEPAKAVAELERLVTTHPRVPQAHYQLGLAHLFNSDLDKALPRLNQAVALDPASPEPVLLLSELLLRKGEASTALTALMTFTNRFMRLAAAEREARGPASLEVTLRRNSILERAQFTMAKAYLEQRQWDNALAIYRQLMAAQSKNPEVPYFAGLVLRQQRKFSEARPMFEKSLSMATNYLPAVEQLVDLDLRETNHVAALKRVQAEIAKFPKAAEPLVLLARVHAAQRDTNQVEMALQKSIELNPDLPEPYLLLARHYVAVNEQDKAMARLEDRLKRNPKDVPALTLMGMIYGQEGKHEKARDTYEKILEISPYAFIALNNLAYLYADRLGKPEKGIDFAQRARRLYPENPWVADTLGWIQLKLGNVSAALPLLTDATSKLPKDPEMQYHLGVALYLLGREESAKAALSRSLELGKDFEAKDDAQARLALLNLDPRASDAKTLAVLQKAVADRPGDSVAVLRLGSIYEQQGNWAQARSLYEKALEADAKLVPVLLRLATVRIDKDRDPAKALDLARAANKLAPDDFEVNRTLGRIVFQAGDHKWAVRLLQDALRVQPNQPLLLYDYAWSLFSVGRVPEASATMQNALQSPVVAQQSTNAAAFATMTALFLDVAKAQAAADQVQKLLQADPGFAPAIAVAAMIYQQQGNGPAAKRAWESVLARFPSFSPANRYLASLYLAEPMDVARAYEHATKAREAFPDDPFVIKTQGMVLYRRGEYSKAVQTLNEAAIKQPQDGETFYYLGLAYHQQKQKRETQLALEKALTMNLNSILATDARKILDDLKK